MLCLGLPSQVYIAMALPCYPPKSYVFPCWALALAQVAAMPINLFRAYVVWHAVPVDKLVPFRVYFPLREGIEAVKHKVVVI